MVKLVQSANALLPKSIFLYLFIFTVFKEEQFEKERDGISFKIELEAKDTVVSFLQNSKQDVDMFCTVFGIETYVKLLHL